MTIQKPIETTFQEEETSSKKALKLGTHVICLRNREKFGETEEERAWGMA